MDIKNRLLGAVSVVVVASLLAPQVHAAPSAPPLVLVEPHEDGNLVSWTITNEQTPDNVTLGIWIEGQLVESLDLPGNATRYLHPDPGSQIVSYSVSYRVGGEVSLPGWGQALPYPYCMPFIIIKPADPSVVIHEECLIP